MLIFYTGLYKNYFVNILYFIDKYYEENVGISISS